MTPDEQRLFDSVVHGLRSAGWSRLEAEGEALNRVERKRGWHGTYHGQPVDAPEARP